MPRLAELGQHGAQLHKGISTWRCGRIGSIGRVGRRGRNAVPCRNLKIIVDDSLHWQLGWAQAGQGRLGDDSLDEGGFVLRQGRFGLCKTLRHGLDFAGSFLVKDRRQGSGSCSFMEFWCVSQQRNEVVYRGLCCGWRRGRWGQLRQVWGLCNWSDRAGRGAVEKLPLPRAMPQKGPR